MQIVPLASIASQNLSIQLNGQSCSINVYQKSTGVYMDLYVAGEVILTGTLAVNNVLMIQKLYLGFLGDLVFIDTEPLSTGAQNPEYTGLGSRWILVYYLPSEVPTFAT